MLVTFVLRYFVTSVKGILFLKFYHLCCIILQLYRPNVLFTQPSFSLGLSQEVAQRTTDGWRDMNCFMERVDDIDGVNECRKSKRLRVVPPSLVG